MSARKVESPSAFQPVTVQSRETRLSLSPGDVRIRKNGVEFRSDAPIPLWTEMTVTLRPADAGKVNCTGVVISCNGSRHNGYVVSMLFTSLSRQSQARLNML